MDRQTPPRRRTGLTPPFFLASVRGRIVFGFALLVVILVAVVAGSAWLAREHGAKLARMQSVATTMSLLEGAKGNGTTSFALLQLYLASGDESLVQQFHASRDAALKAANEATVRENSLGHDPEVASLSQLAAASASLTDSWEQTIALRRAGDIPGAAALMTSTLPAASGIGEALDDVMEVERQELSAIRNEADTTGRLAFWLLVISGAAGAALALSVSILIARSILRPLAALESAAQAVAGGDLNARTRPGGPRELARLSATLNRMTEALLDASKRRELEAALRRSEQQFRSLIENALDIIMGIGPDGALRYMSPSVQRTLGHKPEDLVGTNITDLLHPDDLPAVMAAMAESLRSPEPGPLLEARLRHRDGSWRAVEGIGRSFLDESGAFGIVVTLRDITERKRAEEALRESEERFRALLESAPIAGIVTNAQGRIELLNAAAEEMFGYDRVELIGQSMEILMPERFREEHGRQCADFLANPRRRPMSAGRDVVGLRKDGSEFAATCGLASIDTRNGPLAISFLMDITERKQAEEALREAEERWRSLVENAPDLIMTVDREGTIRFMNHAVPGFTVRDTIGTAAYGYVRPEFHETMRAALERVFETGEPQSYEVAGDGPSGRTSWYASRVGPIMRAGEVVAATIIASDVTERRLAEEALRESEEHLRVLITGAPVILFATDSEGVITLTEGAATGGLPFKPEDIVGRPVSTVFAHVPQIQESTRRALAGEEVAFTVELGELQLDCRVSPLWRDGEAAGLVGVATDITERKLAEEDLARVNSALKSEHKRIDALNRTLERKVKERTRELRVANRELQTRNRQLLDARSQAITDALTGLSNHRAFQERVREEMSCAQINGSGLGLIMMDIDSFKAANDSLGHLAGDRILRRLARTLARTVPQDNAYRYGGDEFAVLLPEASCGETMALAEQLRRSVEKRTNGNREGITISLGVACYPGTASSAEELIYGSDAAMYWAKSAGKNRVGDWSDLVRHRAEGVLPWYAADRAVRAPDTVAALAAALAAKDPATASHTERCSWYAARLAEELGLGERDTSIVRLSSLLHDVGKLAVPDDVLFKPGPLDDHEWTLMRQHPLTALHILGQIRSIADATPAILHHHEHFDGSGYPDGLAGDAIPIASRILLVTDAFDAMTTDRPYRRAMPLETAVEELKRNAGSQFDPVVVAAFMRILERDGAQPLARMASEAADRVRGNGDGGGRRPARVPQPT